MENIKKAVYLILEQQDRIPILVADAKEKAKELLDEYMGLEVDEDVKYVGFEKYDSEYYSPFEGTFTYLTNYPFDKEERTEKFLLYYMTVNDVL
jgi:hypothetical protein